jgi:hypothetical protein
MAEERWSVARGRRLFYAASAIAGKNDISPGFVELVPPIGLQMIVTRVRTS